MGAELPPRRESVNAARSAAAAPVRVDRRRVAARAIWAQWPMADPSPTSCARAAGTAVAGRAARPRATVCFALGVIGWLVPIVTGSVLRARPHPPRPGQRSDAPAGEPLERRLPRPPAAHSRDHRPARRPAVRDSRPAPARRGVTAGSIDLLGLPGRGRVVIATPGPDTALTVRNALVGGRRGEIFTALGAPPPPPCGPRRQRRRGPHHRASEPPSPPVKLGARGGTLVFLGAQGLWRAFRPGDRGDHRPRAGRAPIREQRLPPGRGEQPLARPPDGGLLHELPPQFVPAGRPPFGRSSPSGSCSASTLRPVLRRVQLVIARARRRWIGRGCGRSHRRSERAALSPAAPGSPPIPQLAPGRGRARAAQTSFSQTWSSAWRRRSSRSAPSGSSMTSGACGYEL